MKNYLIIGLVAIVFLGIGIGVSQKKEREQKYVSAPAKAVTVGSISRRADDVPPPIMRAGGQKVVVELETKEVTAEIAPGVTYEYWTYNGTVPGPFIRVKEGDTVEVRLTHAGHDHAQGDAHKNFAIDALQMNIAEAHGDEADGHAEASMDDAHMPSGTMAEHEAAGHGTHSIDLHSVLGPGGGATLTQTKSDEVTAFQFKALRPGLYVYHCASPHIPTHIANGMYGMILVEPAEGLAKVDKEFYVMQGEFYTKGVTGEKGHQEFSLEKLKKEEPEYVVFNGKMGGLAGDGALKAKVGDTIRVFFGVGSFVPSNFHLIGGVFDKLYPEGALISPPLRNVQTTLVPAGGSMMAEFDTADSPAGKYLLVDHALSRAIDKGAVGELILEGVTKDAEAFKKVP
jgi:nitrite reductase (NO-forming)